jgi:Rho GTPase-activating protein 1
MPPGTLSLKQRLAALSLAPSSPSTYDNDSSGSSLRSTLRKKAQQHAPWLKRREDSTAEPSANQLEQVQQVLSKVIFQAGVDYECVVSVSNAAHDILISKPRIERARCKCFSEMKYIKV